MCGCGGTTAIAKLTRSEDGIVAGEHYRFLPSHGGRGVGGYARIRAKEEAKRQAKLERERQAEKRKRERERQAQERKAEQARRAEEREAERARRSEERARKSARQDNRASVAIKFEPRREDECARAGCAKPPIGDAFCSRICCEIAHGLRVAA
jgi:ATPase subunit of ABC transporter with duplicated ATPase domains